MAAFASLINTYVGDLRNHKTHFFGFWGFFIKNPQFSKVVSEVIFLYKRHEEISQVKMFNQNLQENKSY